MADRIPFWLRYAFFAALGFVVAAILPAWATTVFVVVVLVIGWTAVWRRNRRRATPQPPERDWTPPVRDPGGTS